MDPVEAADRQETSQEPGRARGDVSICFMLCSLIYRLYYIVKVFVCCVLLVLC